MFKFEVGDAVKIGNYDGAAEIVGRAEYSKRPVLYLVKYKKADGLPVEEWFDEDDLT